MKWPKKPFSSTVLAVRIEMLVLQAVLKYSVTKDNLAQWTLFASEQKLWANILQAFVAKQSERLSMYPPRAIDGQTAKQELEQERFRQVVQVTKRMEAGGITRPNDPNMVHHLTPSE